VTVRAPSDATFRLLNVAPPELKFVVAEPTLVIPTLPDVFTNKVGVAVVILVMSPAPEIRETACPEIVPAV